MIKKSVKKSEITVSSEMFDLIRKPVITEKSMRGSEAGQVTFIVPLNATKSEIKAAVEAVFGVKVLAVNTIRQDGKRKVFRGIKGVRNEVKKAIVTLGKDQSIDITAGV